MEDRPRRHGVTRLESFRRKRKLVGRSYIIKKADEKFPFLTDRSICKLTEEQTNRLIDALEKAEEFDITVLPEP